MTKRLPIIVLIISSSISTAAFAGPAWGVVRDKVPDEMNFCMADLPSFGPMTRVPCWANGNF